MFSPFFTGVDLVNIDLYPFARAVNQSSVLPILYIAALTSSFTTVLDVALDFKFRTATVDSIERMMIICSLIFSSSIFLIFGGNHILPYIYWNVRWSQTTIKAFACTSVLNKLFPEFFPSYAMITLVSLYSVSLIFQSYFNANSNLLWAETASDTFFYLFLIPALLYILKWYYYLLRKLLTKSSNEEYGFTYAEFMASLYLTLPLVIAFAAT